MKTNSKKFSIKDWFEKNKLYILAFVLPILSMLIVYYFKNIFPFGDQMYLRSDCYHQYTPYLEILQQKLKDGGSLFYTWEIGAGMNFMAVAAYYLTSPLNLLAIIWPGYMADMVSFFIVLKMGLARIFSMLLSYKTFWSEKYFFRSFRYGIRFISLFCSI